MERERGRDVKSEKESQKLEGFVDYLPERN